MIDYTEYTQNNTNQTFRSTYPEMKHMQVEPSATKERKYNDRDNTILKILGRDAKTQKETIQNFKLSEFFFCSKLH